MLARRRRARLVAKTNGDEQGGAAMSEQNKALVRRYLEDVFAQGDLDAIPEVFSSDYVERDPASDEEIRGHEGLRRDLSVYQSALSGIEIAVEDQIAEGDRVVTRAILRASHVEDLFGVPPTGERVEVTGTVTHRIADGRLAEGWWNWDTLGLLRQIGAIPSEQATETVSQ
jgi:steroid delta-isomerase-like uncharacterized protein